MEKQKIYKKICKLCGKEVISLSESQCEHNYNVHKMSCEKKHIK